MKSHKKEKKTEELTGLMIVGLKDCKMEKCVRSRNTNNQPPFC
jgi:hypothetical protein